MRVLLTIIAFIFIGFQAGVTYLWTETDMTERVIGMFASFYEDGVPYWSQKAFSLGRWWYVLTACMSAILVTLLLLKKSKLSLSMVVFSSVLTFFAMLYAMYPLHLMPSTVV